MNKTLSIAIPSVTVAAALIISVFASFAFSGISEKQEYEEILSYIQSIVPTAESYTTTEGGGYTALADGETYFFADVTVHDENGGEARVIVGVNGEGSVVGVNIIYSSGMELMDAEVAAISDAALILNITSTDDNIIVIEPAVSNGDNDTEDTSSDETQSSDGTGSGDTETDIRTDTTALYTDETGEEIKISDPQATSAETEDTAIVTSPNTETTEEDTSEESTEEDSTKESTDEVTEETTTIPPEETTSAPEETTTTSSEPEVTSEPVEETTTVAPEETTTAAEETTAAVTEETTTASSESEVTSEPEEDIGE
ncbi:MAG: hypothetical protein LUG88_05615 [Clostridia bacterium]|nr:hypothetical protein [Clostridia bacterium]